MRGERGEGGAMVLGKLPVPGRPTILMIVGHDRKQNAYIVLLLGGGGGGRGVGWCDGPG